MNVIEDLLVPYVGPGSYHNKKCPFYWYEFYHMPTETCPDWEPLQKDLISENKFSFKFITRKFKFEMVSCIYELIIKIKK